MFTCSYSIRYIRMRILKAIIVACVVAIVLPARAFTVNGINYEATGSQTASVVANWPNYVGSVSIPKTVEYDGVTYTVDAIAPRAFQGAEFLTSVSMQNTVKSIGDNAFDGCLKLNKVVIPSSVSYLGSRAFAECASLSTVTFKGNALTELSNSTFFNCKSLRTITLPDKIYAIRSLAFAGSGLERITMGADLNTIEPFAFDECNSMRSVNVKNIRKWCDIDFISVYDNPLYRARTMLVNGDTLKNLKIPEGVTAIKPFVFAGCNASTIEIPSSVTTIDISAFLYCSYITDVYIPNTVKSLDTSHLIDTDRPFPYVESIYVGKGIEVIPTGTFYFSYRLKSLIMMEGLKEIGHDAFKYSKIPHIVLPQTLKVLQASFANCTLLETVTIGPALRRMIGGVFSQCKYLREIHCQVKNPSDVVFINTGQFNGVDLENCVLYVPSASVNKYKKDPNWGVFKKILPDINQPDIDRSGIVDVEDVNKLVNTFLGHSS